MRRAKLLGMSGFDLHYQRGGVLLRGLDLWLDAHGRQSGPERVLVSHAHSDHAETHREVILTRPTALLMEARGKRPKLKHELEFGETREFRGTRQAWRITLLPAGHIFGSAMGWVECDGRSLLYTGDFKLSAGFAAEPCQPRPADVLIMETTFGRPQYRFPSAEAVLPGIRRFCCEAIDNDETPVLLGYSLGKSQEVLRGLAGAGLPVVLHEQVHRLTRVYERLGLEFPPYRLLKDAEPPHRQVVICPPTADLGAVVHGVRKVRTAVLTGWAVDPGCRYQQRCDAAFPLSDHADFDELLELVRRVRPSRVYTLHGFAADFAATLREEGWDARALSESEQLNFVLAGVVTTVSPEIRHRIEREASTSTKALPERPFAFLAFARVAIEIGRLTDKQDKVRCLAEYLQALEGATLAWAVRWVSGQLQPPERMARPRVGWALLRDGLCEVTGLSRAAVQAVYLKHNDAGATFEELWANRLESRQTAVEQVGERIAQLGAVEDLRARRSLLASLLTGCSRVEVRVLAKVLSGDLRIGLRSGLVEEAVARAFGRSLDSVRRAHRIRGDMGEVAMLAKQDRLAEVDLQPFRPVRPPSLSRPIGAISPGHSAQLQHGLWCQLHSSGGDVALYDADLLEITPRLPGLVEAVAAWGAEVILHGLLVGLYSGDIRDLAATRYRRRIVQRELFGQGVDPVVLWIVDLWWFEGRTWLDAPRQARRRVLQSLEDLPGCLRVAAEPSVEE